MKIINRVLLPSLILFAGHVRAADSTTDLNCYYITPIEQRFLQTHVTQSQMSHELEKRTSDAFFGRLDGNKLYLLQSDETEIRRSLTNIFEKIKSQDCGPLVNAQALFMKRLEERIAFAKIYLGPTYKVEKNLKYQPHADQRKRALTKAAAEKVFKTQLQAEVAGYLHNDMSLEESKKRVLASYDRIWTHFKDKKNRDLFAMYLDCFALSLDPHSDYMSAEQLDEFNIQMRLSLDGIGASLSWDNGMTTIERLVPGGAALQSGKLKRKDKIVGVAQEPGEPFTDTIDMELPKVIKLIRGKRGTSVRLNILRKTGGANEHFEVTLVRSEIKLAEQGAILTYQTEGVGGEQLKIAVIHLPSFYHDDRNNDNSASQDVKRLLAKATEEKANALVLDLSSNGGGSLSDAVDMVGLFIAKGNVVRLGRRDPNHPTSYLYETLADQDPEVNWPGPLVILTDRASASASEIVSGSLHDYGRALIVGGDQTFGKGTMQTVEQLPPGLGAIKTTAGMFFTAGGQSTQHRGVPGDILLPSLNARKDIGEKMNPFSLPPKKIEPFLSSEAQSSDPAARWTPLTPALIADLKLKSEERVKASAEFKKIEKELKASLIANNKPLTIAELIGNEPVKKTETEEKPDEPEKILSAEEKAKSYLARPDIQEVVHIASDLVKELKSRESAPRHPSAQSASIH